MSMIGTINRWPVLLAIGAAALLAGGCVNQGEYDNLHTTNRSLTDANGRLTQERDQARWDYNSTRDQLLKTEEALGQVRAENADLRDKLGQALAKLDEFGARLQGLQFTALDAETDAALRELAAQYPDLITYDPVRGMLRFNADLTFDSGQIALKPEAKSSLEALAKILNSSAAAPYEVHVVGHTDTQRLSAGTAQQYRTNRGLSAWRAISVIDSLAGLGVPAEKLMAAGWGECRPLVPNVGNGNTPQNRRVEIFLTRPRPGETAAASTAAAPVVAAPPEPALDPTK